MDVLRHVERLHQPRLAARLRSLSNFMFPAVSGIPIAVRMISLLMCYLEVLVAAAEHDCLTFSNHDCLSVFCISNLLNSLFIL